MTLDSLGELHNLLQDLLDLSDKDAILWTFHLKLGADILQINPGCSHALDSLPGRFKHKMKTKNKI